MLPSAQGAGGCGQQHHGTPAMGLVAVGSCQGGTNLPRGVGLLLHALCITCVSLPMRVSWG